MLIILDNEAVSALSDPASNKHRQALAYIEATTGPRRRRPVGRTIVPTTVRVEAGWDRSDPRAATINRLGLTDHELDTAAANTAAMLRQAHQVSPADAHIGAAIHNASDNDVKVITSDDGDIAKVAEDKPARIIHL